MGHRMRRREFLELTAGVAVWPLIARAQSTERLRRVGILHPGYPPDPWLDGLRDGLRVLGYVEGRNLTLDYRWGEGQSGRLEALAQELLDLQVDVIVSMTGPAVLAAKKRTSTIPIVMAVSGDPVGTGAVTNLARPDQNVTGFSLMSGDLAGLRLALLKEAVPTAQRIAVLYNPAEPPTKQELSETGAAAQTLGIVLQPIQAGSRDALDSAFSDAATAKADAIITFAHGFAFFHRRRIAELATQFRIPAMYGWREFVDVGGLMAYGPNVTATLRRAATYVDRLLKGARPADLPVQQPTEFELVINLKVAKTLGLMIPQTVLFRANEIVE